jgi:hypothetical protein
MSDSNPIQTPSIAPGGIPHKKAADYRVVYSNIFQYRVSNADCSIIFSTLSDTGDEPQTFEQTHQVEVIMALGQIKNLAEYLSMIVARYEREIAPINGIGEIPPNETELDSIFKILHAVGVHR